MRHEVAAIGYVGAWALIIFGELGEAEAPALVLIAVASVVAGVVSGSWWAVALALAVPVLAELGGCGATERCDYAAWLVALMVWTPISGALIAAGVAVRKLSSSRR